MFWEPIHQVLEKIKNESFSKWPNKMGGDPKKRNQSLHCQYHQNRRHTTEDCRTLRSHLGQLVREWKLKQFLHQPNGPRGLTGSGFQGNAFSRAFLGTVKSWFTNMYFVGFYSVPNLIVIIFNLLYPVFIVGFGCKGYVLKRERECQNSSN